MDLRENKALTPVESGFPIRSITMDLTTGCNLACDYCFTQLSKGEYKCGTLSFEMAMDIVDWLMDPGTRGDHDSVDITFWGGEPLLEWELLQRIVAYAEMRAREYGIKVTFNGTTNVTLLTPDKFDFCDQHKLYFLLSIDGTKEHHDKHRVFKDGSGSWDLVDKNVEAILERWPDYQARLSYSTDNIETLLDDLKYLHSKGFKSIAYSPVAEGDWTDEKIAALYKTWDEITDWYEELQRNGDDIYLKFVNDSCKRMYSPDGNTAPCGAGRGYVGVTIDGSIYPCHRFHKFNDERPWYEREVCLGNIKYGILNQEWRKNFMEWDIYSDMEESCKSCKAFGKHCSGGCWATNWDINGSLAKNPRVSCESTYANMKSAERLLSELGEKFQNRYKPARRQNNLLPPVQGCQCYNVEDMLYGRKTVNKKDPYRCLCNMAVYGSEPRQVTSCTCYNRENTVDGISHYDMTGTQCGQFTAEHECGGTCSCKEKDPVQEALEYLRRSNIEFEKLNEKQKLTLTEFVDELEKRESYLAQENLVKNITDAVE